MIPAAAAAGIDAAGRTARAARRLRAWRWPTPLIARRHEGEALLSHGKYTNSTAAPVHFQQVEEMLNSPRCRNAGACAASGIREGPRAASMARKPLLQARRITCRGLRSAGLAAGPSSRAPQAHAVRVRSNLRCGGLRHLPCSTTDHGSGFQLRRPSRPRLRHAPCCRRRRVQARAPRRRVMPRGQLRIRPSRASARCRTRCTPGRHAVRAHARFMSTTTRSSCHASGTRPCTSNSLMRGDRGRISTSATRSRPGSRRAAPATQRHDVTESANAGVDRTMYNEDGAGRRRCIVAVSTRTRRRIGALPARLLARPTAVGAASPRPPARRRPG